MAESSPDGRRRRDRIVTATLLGTIGCLVIGLGRVAQLETAPGEVLLDQIGRRTRTSIDLAFRGAIKDRRGRTLAESVPGHDLAVDVKVLLEQARTISGAEDADPRPALAEAIARVTSLDGGEMHDLLAEDDDARYVRLGTAERIDFIDVEALRAFRIEWKGDRFVVGPGVRPRPKGDRSRKIGALVLTERPVRRGLRDSPAASIVGAVRAVEWSPSDPELDRLASDVVVDPGAIRAWLDSIPGDDETPTERPTTLESDLGAALGAVLGADAAEIERRLLRSGDEPIRLAAAEHLDPWRVRRIRSISLGGRTVPRRFLLDIVDEDGLEALRRQYPKQRGASGVEAARDEDLRERHGRMIRTVAAGSQTLFVEDGGFEAGEDGRDISLTIDLEIQRIVDARLRRAMEEHQAVGGWAVVLDPQTGEILAAVDVLDDEAAVERGGWPEGFRDRAREELGPEFARNRTWTDTFDPGSTFKSLFWAWATDLGKASPEELIEVPGGGMAGGVKMFGKRPIRDVFGYGGDPNRPSTWSLCLEKSINTGMATVARRMDNEQMVEMFRRFGLTRPTGIDVGYEGRLAHPAVDQWVPNYTKLSASFGQAVSITPLQLARAYCALARDDGRLPMLSLVSAPLRPYETPSTPTVSEATARATREILGRQFESIRDKYYDGEGIPYTAFGKSATAQWSDHRIETVVDEAGDSVEVSRNVGYHEDRYLSSYVGAAPLEDARIVVAFGLQDPLKGRGANADLDGRGHLGSYAAGRPVHDLLGEILTYLGVPADRATVEPAG